MLLPGTSPVCAPAPSPLCPRRIAVFSVTVLHDERIVIVAEQRPDSTEEDSFQWMSRVLQVALPALQSLPCFVPASLDRRFGRGRPSATGLLCSLAITPLGQKLHRPGNV